jgi:uncharacterized damage-inducible protein DinB
MDFRDLLIDGFTRVSELVDGVVDGLSNEALTTCPGSHGNSITWLAWHIARGQDAQIADVAGHAEVWLRGGWADRFALPIDPADNGYGHTTAQMKSVTVDDPTLLTGYNDAVLEQTTAYLRGLTEEDLDRVVDANWDPPVTLGARLISILSDDLQHAGQAADVRGLVDG